MKRLLSFLLLPLSVIPFLAVAPTIVQSRERFERTHHMGPLPAPAAAQLSAARYPGFYAPADEVPVLVWHGIDSKNDGYSVSQTAFEQQIALLDKLGYTSISMRQWADFRAGKTAGLPAKPILLTFDDGRLDSYRGADKILQRYGMRATIFVITEEIEKANPFYLTWEELHDMRDSGRWDIQPHAHAGHHELAVNAQGDHAPFYAARRFTTSGGVETLAQWETRVSQDLFTVRERFADHGIDTLSFAVPYGDYGQRTTNDPSIPKLLSGLLTRQFGNWFIQADDNDPDFTHPGTGAASRYELTTGARLDSLYGWLRRHSTDEEKD
jgi:peptidoglycan/xylan/chitin deacetylase (PgdA/CDA1 family)